MREIICALYIMIYTLITAPARYINSRKMNDLELMREGLTKNYRMTQTLCKGILKIMGARVDIEGKSNLETRGPNVYMGTHKSYLDIVIMIALIDEPLIFIGKAEVDKLPFIRKWFKAIGGLPMQREDIRQSFKVILEAIKRLEAGYSVAIFPEGTRTIGTQMGEFKAGSFKLATKANVPIVPIAMQNTFKLLEEQRRVRPADIYVNIGEIIDVPNLTKEKKKTISGDTEDYIRQLLNEITY